VGSGPAGVCTSTPCSLAVPPFGPWDDRAAASCSGRRSVRLELRIPAARGIRPYVPNLDCIALRVDEGVESEGLPPADEPADACRIGESRSNYSSAVSSDRTATRGHFEFSNSHDAKRPTWHSCAGGALVFLPWLDRSGHSRSASSGSGHCAQFVFRTLVWRVRSHSVFPRDADVRRACADGGAPALGEDVGGLSARNRKHQSGVGCQVTL